MKKAFIIFISFICQTSFADTKVDEININSNIIEIKKESNQIFFKNNVKIDSGVIEIKADDAIYENLNKTIHVYGKPSSLQSSDNINKFSGEASEMIFYSNSKIELIGTASLKYDNIEINSENIIFNPVSGEMSSYPQNNNDL
tara:strand:- start:461 stop:889 length:429 start_codon:yes stop_codon:yes gene_type:complete